MEVYYSQAGTTIPVFVTVRGKEGRMGKSNVIVNVYTKGVQLVSLTFSVEDLGALRKGTRICLDDIGECISDVSRENFLKLEGILEYTLTLNEGKEDEIQVYRMRLG